MTADDTGATLTRVVVGPLRTNCYLITGSDDRVVVVDPGADAPAIDDAIGGRAITAIVLTHAHFDHVNAVPELQKRHDVPVCAHPAETAVWRHALQHLERHGHFDAGTATAQLLAQDAAALRLDGPAWDGAVTAIDEGHRWELGDTTIEAVHTPGHTPGGLTLRVRRDADVRLLTGDTLFPGGPGLTGWPLSDFDTIMTSVRRLLIDHPAATPVLPGHGVSTTVGRERPHVAQWMARGW